ncbi:CHAT domain-containing protein [Streptomyces sp. NPDC007205]|uniref:CHAT domain-containing protein n=1 Tax=Streptomyces sp. NPDC007205 TaxID=3154316 RepID=UPI0033C1BC81
MRGNEQPDGDRSKWNADGCRLVAYGRNEEAERAFLRAAAQGEFNAMYNLGLLTERMGRAEEAGKWYVRAHLAGHPEAANNLGCLLLNADDPGAAVVWFRVAADAGHPQAAENLKLCTDRPAPTHGGDPLLRPVVLDLQAEAAYEHFAATGTDASLVRAVNLHRQAVRTASADHPQRLLFLTHLRDILWQRYELRGHDTDLRDAVSAALDVWQALPQGSTERLAAARVTIDLLRKHCELTHDSGPLRAQLSAARRELRHGEENEEAWALLASAVAAALVSLARHTDDEDCDEAVELGRAALQRLPGRGAVLVNLGGALVHRGQRKGDLDDIDAAVTVLNRAIDADPGSAYPVAAVNLASALGIRAELTGRSEDARRARAIAAEASAALGADGSVHPQTLLRAACVAGDELALGSLRRALAVLPPTHAERPALLAQLAMELHRGGEREEAVTVAREAVRTATTKEAGVAARHMLGSVLLTGGEQGVAPADAAVAEAVRTLAAAALACDKSAVHYADVLIKWASALLMRFMSRSVASDRTEALKLLRTAADATGSALGDRLFASQVWSGVALEAGDPVDALAGARVAVSLLQRYGWMGLDRADQEQGLRDGAAMPREAAALAILTDQPELAVELLEQGRSVLWRTTMHMRGDLSVLAERQPVPAEKLEQIRIRLHTTGDLEAETRVSLARQWSTLLEEVRAEPGFEAFLKPPSFRALTGAAAAGPVVIVNISTIRCDALIVRPSGQPQVVPLPGVTVPEVDRVANTYVAHLAQAEEQGATALQKERARHTVHDTLEWLWEHVAQPVLARLASAGEGMPARVWWCPTASLAMLPLHAAGRYPRGAGDTWPPVGVPYQVVSSYTTTLHSLVMARRPPTHAASGLLAVALTDTRRGHTPLPGVEVEIRALKECFSGRRMKVLADDACTMEAVRTHLPSYAWSHFACHGKLDMTAPSTSGLCLRDGDMNVLDFANLRLEEAELAFLSACLTHVGSSQLPDEAIHTAAALRMAGYRHVVATLWSIHDQAAPRVAAAFYGNLLAKGADVSNSAEALHLAVAELRKEHLHDPTVWAPFAHNGP